MKDYMKNKHVLFLLFVFMAMFEGAWAPQLFGQCDDCEGGVCDYNIAIENWMLPGGLVRSPDVRINTDPDDPFNSAGTENVKVQIGDNVIYFRFWNNSLYPFPASTSVTVTASFLEAEPGKNPLELEAHLTAMGSGWETLGIQTVSLPDDLGQGESYKNGLPCTFNPSQPLPSSFFLKVQLQYDSSWSDQCSDDNIAYSYYDLTSGAPPVDVVLVHDCSRSMLGELPLAKDRAKMFFDLMNPTDKVAVVAFSTSLSGHTQVVFPTSYTGTMPEVSTFTSAEIGSAIDSLEADGCTPMGAGVALARNILYENYEAGRNQSIILLTDGKENYDPKLLDPPDYDVLSSLNDIDGDADRDIYLYPLWFGTVSDWGLELLQEIGSGGPNPLVDKYKIVDQPSNNLKLAKSYLMLRGILTSDDVFDIHEGTANDGYSNAIEIDPVINEMIITVATSTIGTVFDIEVIAPGTSGWVPASSLTTIVLEGGAYKIYRFKDPIPGTWQYRLAPNNSPEKIVLALMTDTAKVIMQSHLESNSINASECIAIHANLSQGNITVTGAIVTAEISIPYKSLGTILNEVRGKLGNITVPTGSDISKSHLVAKKMQKILQSKDIVKYKTQTVTLHDDGRNGDPKAGDGDYTAKFYDTNTAGTYRIDIFANNKPGSPLAIERHHEHAAVVGLGEIDPEKSIVDHVLVRSFTKGNKKYNTWKIIASPFDIHGNGLFSDFASKVGFIASHGKWEETETIDNEDGSYQRHITIEQGKGARIKTIAFGRELSTIRIGKSRNPGQISFHVANARPTGDFADIVDSGYGYMFDIGYHFHPNYSIIGFYGYNRFPYKKDEKAYTNIHNLSLNLRGRTISGIFSLYCQAGGGMYRLFDQWRSGYNVGAGVILPLSGSLEIDGGGNYHTVFTDEDTIRFLQLHLGMVIRF